MEAKEGRITKNHQVLWATLITLVVGIFAFAQVYIVIALNQMENRLDQLTQNYIDHLEYHVQGK